MARETKKQYTWPEYLEHFYPEHKSLDDITDPDEFIAAARRRHAELVTLQRISVQQRKQFDAEGLR